MNELEYKLHIDTIIERIETARIKVSEYTIVKIVAVSKYNAAEDIAKLYNIGQRAFGENRVQDLVAKQEALEELPLEWHYIGNLQRNKLNALIKADPFLFQSLDSIELANALQRRLADKETTMDCLLQINSANEETKAGVTPEKAVETFANIRENCPNIHLKGVMSIGAHTDDQAVIRKSFETTYKIYEQLDDVSICSMGMSGDFELAIECGSNMLRLGSIMFPKGL
ncbi:MAG: YggS family pyridoxal phosphate-dependent enzyme [Sulfurimonadaceae bacterium]